MPLNHSGSKASVGQNIRILRAEGRPQRQAVAIALSVQRDAQTKKGAHKETKGNS